jgi:23S rRNA pseudouridine2605 synthase
MRINKYIARATGLSRRAADDAIGQGRVLVNGQSASNGADITPSDTVTLDHQPVVLTRETTTIMLNKPAGYVCSRDGQGSPTIYELLPAELGNLKSVGRLDKNSSGLLLLTDDGDLANKLTHPRYVKEKVYEVTLSTSLRPEHRTRIEKGVKLEDGSSKLQIANLEGTSFTVTMSEGRNRQIRRTFQALGYTVAKLHRVQFGAYHLGQLAPTEYEQVYYKE